MLQPIRFHCLGAWISAGLRCTYLRSRPRVFATCVSKSTTCICDLRNPRVGASRRKECPLFDPLNSELNPICHLLTLLGGATIVDVSRLRVNSAGAYSGGRLLRVGTDSRSQTVCRNDSLFLVPTLGMGVGT